MERRDAGDLVGESRERVFEMRGGTERRNPQGSQTISGQEKRPPNQVLPHMNPLMVAGHPVGGFAPRQDRLPEGDTHGAAEAGFKKQSDGPAFNLEHTTHQATAGPQWKQQ